MFFYSVPQIPFYPTHQRWVFIFNWCCSALEAALLLQFCSKGSKGIKIEARRALQRNWKRAEWVTVCVHFCLRPSTFHEIFSLCSAIFRICPEGSTAFSPSFPSSAFPSAVIFHFNFLEESINTFAFKSFSRPQNAILHNTNTTKRKIASWRNVEMEKLQTIFASMKEFSFCSWNNMPHIKSLSIRAVVRFSLPSAFAPFAPFLQTKGRKKINVESEIRENT